MATIFTSLEPEAQGELLPAANVRHVSSTIASNDISKALGLGPRYLVSSICLVDLYQVCSNGGPEGGGLEFKKEIYLKILFPKNCFAQVLEIWYVASNQGPRVQDGPAPGVLGPNHRNAQKYIKKSSSEPLGLHVLHLVCSIA